MQAFKHKTDTICLPELPAFLLACTTKQTAQFQSVGDRLQKCVRLSQYSDWLPRKYILKLANCIIANFCYMRERKRRSIWKIKKAHALCALTTKEHFSQIS